MFAKRFRPCQHALLLPEITDYVLSRMQPLDHWVLEKLLECVHCYLHADHGGSSAGGDGQTWCEATHERIPDILQTTARRCSREEPQCRQSHGDAHSRRLVGEPGRRRKVHLHEPRQRGYFMYFSCIEWLNVCLLTTVCVE